MAADVMMRAAVALCLLTACGRIGFDATGAGNDAAIVGRWLRGATNGASTCAITLTGELWCWGYGVYSNLGNGSIPAQAPRRVGADTDWTEVGTGAVMTCGLRSDSTLWCWGTNEFDVIVGTPSQSTVPFPVRIGTGTWKQFAVGDRHVCAIDSGDVLVCWGEGDLGVLGNGTTNLMMPPTPVVAVGTNRWRSVTTSVFTTCGIQTDSTLWCWGYNPGGQVGDGSQTLRSAPVQIGAGRLWTAVSASREHTCALDDNGQSWCWGNNYFGEAGDGVRTTTAQTLPVRSSMIAPLASLAVGRAHTCGHAMTGELLCWGNGERGQLGIVIPASPQPVTIAPAANQLIAGGDVTCFIDLDAHLLCTGANSYGEAGGEPGIGLTPTQSDARTDWTEISAASSHACAQTAAGSTECWGLNSFGELANGMPQDQDTPQVASGTYSAIALGTYTFAGLVADGSLWLSGLFPNLSATTLVPTSYAPTGSTKAVSIGNQHGCRIQSDNTLVCGGLNNRGQLGDNTYVNKEAVVLGGTWGVIAAGPSSTCGVTLGGQLQCWGRNDTGQLGTGNTNDAPTPQPVALPGATGPATVLALGSDFTCAVTSTSELYCWGAGGQGQLGTGAPSASTTPVRVGTASDWRHVSAGDIHACAIKRDNTLWCWGHNDEGQLGSTLGNKTAPVQVGGAEWRDVATGDHFTCAIKLDGTRWCFGRNVNGELGNGLGWREQFVVIP
jgi:alpha-tubulin suppressor-like RCC1 family protein